MSDEEHEEYDDGEVHGMGIPFDPTRPIEEQLPEDMPDEIRRMLTGIMQRIMSDRIKSGHTADLATENLMPSDRQLSLKPGDRCVQSDGLKSGNTQGAPLTICELLDPEQHTEDFPDWETRMLNSYVLCRYWTNMELTHEFDVPEIGWFSRVHLIKVPENYMWEELRGYVIHNEVPVIPPAWLCQMLVSNAVEIGRVNGDFIPSPTRCPECGSTAVMLSIHQSMTDLFYIGHRDPEHYEHDTNVFTYGQYSRLYSNKKTLLCMACEYAEDLDDSGKSVHMHNPTEGHLITSGLGGS